MHKTVLDYLPYLIVASIAYTGLKLWLSYASARRDGATQRMGGIE